MPHDFVSALADILEAAQFLTEDTLGIHTMMVASAMDG